MAADTIMAPPGGWSAHLSMLFTEVAAGRRPEAARAAGFSVVETWWPSEDLDAWTTAVRRAGVGVALINAEAGDVLAGERGFLNVAALRDRELGRVREAVRVAARLGAPRVNVLVGRSLPGIPARRQRAEIVGALREAAADAVAAGITLVVEPINAIDVPGYLLPRAVDAHALIQSVGSSGVRLLYDAYHAARAGADPAREALAFLDVIDHVQFADCPGRGAPGTGTLDLGALVEALSAAGYQGAIGLEYDPHGDTAASLELLGLKR
jgi:hydroxypyruvate isomerase